MTAAPIDPDEFFAASASDEAEVSSGRLVANDLNGHVRPVATDVHEGERVPPHDLDAERAAISAVLVDESALSKVAFLRPEHFYSEAHRRIFEACVGLDAEGTPIDPVTVGTWLRSRDRIAQVGGMAGITEILNAAPAVANIVAYGQTVLGRWRARQIVLLGQRLAAQGFAGIEADAMLEGARGELATVARTATSTGFRVWNAPDIWAPIAPPDYALASLCRGDIGMMVAHGGSLKSWAAIAAVIAKASGKPWLERFPCKAEPSLYLDSEMGADECRRRFQRNAIASGVRGPVDGVSLVSMPGFYLSQAEGIAAIAKLAEGRALIVVDSLSAFSPDVDENDARFSDPLKRMKEIADATRCAFLVLHHARKAKDNEDERESPRGTSALFAACDAVFQLSRDGDAFLLRQTKARKGKAIAEFVVAVQDVEGVEATRVYAREPGDDATGGAGSSSLEKAKRAVLLVLGRDHDVRSGSELARRIGGRKKQVLDALKEHEERGLIVRHKGVLRLASEVL